MKIRNNNLNIGDKVYWKIRVGIFYRTLSGKIINIENEIATITAQTQNTYGKQYKKHVNTLTKSK